MLKKNTAAARNAPKPVRVAGVSYASVNMACKAHGVPQGSVKSRMGKGQTAEEAILALVAYRREAPQQPVAPDKKVFVPELIFSLPEGIIGQRIANELRRRHTLGEAIPKAI